MTEHWTPTEAWRDLETGNARFLAGAPAHPRQDVDRREQLAAAQVPHAALFGCSDSRLAAEIIFDQGLGDLFVVRNAGQVVSDSAIASLEYAVAVLGVPLVVVLGHDSCGAVQAAIDAAGPDAPALPPLIATHVAPIAPAVAAVKHAHPGVPIDPDSVGGVHLERTVAALLARSELLSVAVADGTLAIVGAQYRLAEGRAERRIVIGAL